MFTTITLCPKSVASFVGRYVSSVDKAATIQGKALDQDASDYAVELVTDLQYAIDHVCRYSGEIDKLSDEESVEFKFESDGIVWDGSLWITVHDDLPGCPVEVNCSIAYYSEDRTHETLLGTFPEERYEAFDVVVTTAYSRSDVHEIKRELQAKEVQAYVKGYASGQESMALGFHK